ncbi:MULTISPECIES: DNA cytosine methyltransferase [unclassified Tatumella]|uniref:DNA cytosine methyltransferase n=1 Tax=unclassified Tatumella TaxID=2649542 RepID=UPI001BAFE34F|nr:MULTISPECIES: DNA cytosine methyltransferase [unclassified Tatumella]MBS0855968.1 DNA cytosine methyltransferase [Tatumella sp. JGM16]MBS0912947.1 DNA cytosine methyltransferase [Tatumella sp. JGM91]
MTAYYNEFDPKAAAWLRELIKQGHIADGVVDERSITDVRPEDLEGFTQCHFFAGIGGWSYALRLAGVPDDYPCWTGSPPCQPFSVAGKQEGQHDPRHLAPTFMRLVEQCQPPILFGEQVAAAIGKHWLDDLFIELEGQNYACGSAVLPACSVGAPHKRDRLFFGAVNVLADAGCDYDSSKIKTTNNVREEANRSANITCRRGISCCCVADSDSEQRNRLGNIGATRGHEPANCNRDILMADSDDSRLERREGMSQRATEQPAGSCGLDGGSADTDNSFWPGADWLGCRDGKFRPVEPGTFPLANGIPARVVRLRGYGNAIVPQVAAEFIGAFLDNLAETPCTACGFPATDNQLCDTCEELYSAKSPNFYDLGGDDGQAEKAETKNLPPL